MPRLARRQPVRRLAFVAEEEAVTDLTLSAGGGVQARDRHLGLKAGLDRSLARQVWGVSPAMLRRRAQEAPTVVVEVDPHSPHSPAEFFCVACGHLDLAGVNAAGNVPRLWATGGDAGHAVA